MEQRGYKIVILGGGIAGLATALALTKFASTGFLPRIDVFEIRPGPGTIGGAMSLTPNGLRVLAYLGVYAVIKKRQYGLHVDAVEVFSIYKPKKLAESSFRGPNGLGVGEPAYKAIRITRASLMEALIETVDKHPNITLHYGKRAKQIIENDVEARVSFEDRTSADGDILLGCDGVHSFTRNTHVDPDRRQIYSGVSNAFAFAPIHGQKLHFEATALNFARQGLLLTSLYEDTKTSGYMGAIISIPNVGSREEWKVKGTDAKAVRVDMMERFGGSVFPAVRAFIEGADDWYMWPVYMLPAGGRWATQRTMLLGDAAHAMPPQGESTGILLENAVMFARCLLRKQEIQGTIKEAFDAFEKLRRKRIDQAYKESQGVVNSVKDVGYFGHKLMTWIIPIFLWMGRSRRLKSFEEDVTKMPLGFEEPGQLVVSDSQTTLRRIMDNLGTLKILSLLWYRVRLVWADKNSEKQKQ